MGKFKKMDLQEFVDRGYLQEVNRQFFNPLGLALEVMVQKGTRKTERFGGIWDFRNTSEGVLFKDLSTNEAKVKAASVEAQRKKLSKSRLDLYGFEVQPIGHMHGEK